MEVVKNKLKPTGNKLVIAQATQHTVDGEDKEWIVHSEGKELWRLPAKLTAQEAMDIIHFGRKFEEEAFNNGILFEKNKTPEEVLNLRKIVLNLKAENQVLLDENERIGTKLDELLTSEF